MRNFTELFGSSIMEVKMGGWSSAESRLRNLDKKSKAVEQGNRVSVVYMDTEGNIDWPPNAGAGVLVVPLPMSKEEWVRWSLKHVDLRC